VERKISDIPDRKSIRLKEYDYSLGGAYFVTICAQDYICCLGEITGGKVFLGDAGQMVDKWWNELSNKFNTIENDIFIIMPNHIHGIILLHDTDFSNMGADLRVCPNDNISGEHTGSLLLGNLDSGEHIGSPLQKNNGNVSLFKIIQWFKTMTTNEYIRNVKLNNWEKFEKRLWQRNYYEHIIRNNESYKKIGEYILNNPAKWVEGKELGVHPENYNF
jgi:REP element-mobilizing transposase RayT